MRRELLNQGDQPECRVGFWQGYVMGQFYAIEPDAATPFRLSPLFRTWTLRGGNIPVDELPGARAVLADFVNDLVDSGWRVVGTPIVGYAAGPTDAAAGPPPPEKRRLVAITEEALMDAVDRLGGRDGATAAQVGQELLGEEASTVRNLPQRVGTKLRHLHLQGKVERRQKEGKFLWVVNRANTAEPSEPSAHL
jgi:hypothetical protein